MYVQVCVFINASHLVHQHNQMQISDLNPTQDIAVIRTSLLISVTEYTLKLSETRCSWDEVKLASRISLKTAFSYKRSCKKNLAQNFSQICRRNEVLYLFETACPVKQGFHDTLKYWFHTNQPSPYSIFVRKQMDANIKTYLNTFKSSKEKKY